MIAAIWARKVARLRLRLRRAGCCARRLLVAVAPAPGSRLVRLTDQCSSNPANIALHSSARDGRSLGLGASGLGDAQHRSVEVVRLVQEEELQPLGNGQRAKRRVDPLAAQLVVRHRADPGEEPTPGVLEPA